MAEEQIDNSKVPLANHDTEDMLNELAHLAELRRKDPEVEKRYEWLREHLAPLLHADGPRFYLDDAGHKFYAQAVAPEAMVVDVARMEELYNDGLITYDTFEKACPRKANLEAYEQLVSQGHIGRDQMLYTSHPVPRTKFVKVTAVQDES